MTPLSELAVFGLQSLCLHIFVAQGMIYHLLVRTYLTYTQNLFNLYAEYIMRNSGLEEAQAGIKIAGKNINNLRYADDTTLMAESDEL